MRPLDFLGPIAASRNAETVAMANYLCNEYGMDTISTGNVIAFTMEAYQKGDF